MKQWPEEDRPREKLLKHGTSALSLSELLAILIRVGTKHFSALALAQQLLQHFGSLHALFSAPPGVFCAIKGLGVSHYTQLHAALALGQRYLQEEVFTPFRFTDGNALEQFLLSKLSLQQREVFAVLFLNTKSQFIAYEELFFGSIQQTTVHPREVIKRVLAHNAAAIIIAHNHPSGDPTPSSEDYTLTEALQEALKWLDVKIVQHIVVGKSRCKNLWS